MRDGMLVGYVPRIDGSEDFDESRIVGAIVRTDYDQPIARQRTVAPAAAPPFPAKAASSAVSTTAFATGNEANGGSNGIDALAGRGGPATQPGSGDVGLWRQGGNSRKG